MKHVTLQLETLLTPKSRSALFGGFTSSGATLHTFAFPKRVAFAYFLRADRKFYCEFGKNYFENACSHAACFDKKWSHAAPMPSLESHY